jgi:23S rRNA pseudouridine1911/1915/1917 synthase
MEPQIIYEDSDVLVINKPAGLIVHSDGRTHEPSVAEWVSQHYPSLVGVGEPWLSPQGEIVDRPGIVHRLDRTTSGVMILAKTSEAHAFLKKQFQDRKVQKVYEALVYGHPKNNSGIIEAEIARVRSVPPRWSARLKGVQNKKRAAITLWRVIQKAQDPMSKEPVSIVEAEPKTGRTHQIRVHLQALGYPIVSDHLYAPKKTQLLGLTRPALHAKSLSIELPSQKQMTFEAPLPDDMHQAIESLVPFAE